MVMYDGSQQPNMDLAIELGLSFPILSDPGGEVFPRFNPDADTPESAFIDKGMVVHTLDVIWHPGLVEEILYGEDAQ
jgi:hypothetical protein